MALIASTDFRRSNHERSRQDSIDEYLQNGLDVEEYLQSQIENGEMNGLLNPFEENEVIQSVLAIPDFYGFSDPFNSELFENFEPNDLIDLESVDTPCLTPSSSSGSEEIDTLLEEPIRHNVEVEASSSKPPSTPPKKNIQSTNTPSKSTNPLTPAKWFGAHAPAQQEAPVKVETPQKKSNTIRLDGILVSSDTQSSTTNQKVVPRALLEKLKAAAKRNSRQSILLPVPDKASSGCTPKNHINLDHDYCIDRTRFEKDDLEVQPMELEAEEEKSFARIEVLPDLSLAARSKQVNRNPRSLLKVNQIPEKEEEEFVAVTDFVEEEVVASESGISSDSGVERREMQEGRSHQQHLSRRKWKDERKRRRRSSSRSSSSNSSCSRTSERRRRCDSKRRNERRRSRSGARSQTSNIERSSRRRRSRSRCSSPDYSIGSDSCRQAGWSHGKTERKNIWSMEPHYNEAAGAANRPPKTAMQLALDKIRKGGDRQVLYVGAIPEGTTRNQLRERFVRFGAISEVSVHFRDTGENYGFVTFVNAENAYEARDHANDDRSLPFLKMSFGGRRQFCGQQWADLDGLQEKEYLREGLDDLVKRNDDFDSLLNQLKQRR